MIHGKASLDGSHSARGIEDLDSIAWRIYKSYSRRNSFVKGRPLPASERDCPERWRELQRGWNHLPSGQKTKWYQRALVGYTHQFVRCGLLNDPKMWDFHAARIRRANLPPDEALCPNCSYWIENQHLLVHILLCESKSPYTQ